MRAAHWDIIINEHFFFFGLVAIHPARFRRVNALSRLKHQAMTTMSTSVMSEMPPSSIARLALNSKNGYEGRLSHFSTVAQQGRRVATHYVDVCVDDGTHQLKGELGTF